MEPEVRILSEDVSQGITIKKVAPILDRPTRTELNATIEGIQKSLKDIPCGRLEDNEAQTFFWGIIGEVEHLCRNNNLVKLIEEWQAEVGEKPDHYSLTAATSDGIRVYFYAERQRELESTGDPREAGERVMHVVNSMAYPIITLYAVKTLYAIEVQIGAYNYRTKSDDVCLVAFNFNKTRYVVSTTE